MAAVIGKKAENGIEKILQIIDPKKKYDAVHAMLVVSLALDLLGTEKGVREAAKRIRRDCDFSGVYIVDLVLKSNKPLAVVRMCLANLEV